MRTARGNTCQRGFYTRCSSSSCTRNTAVSNAAECANDRQSIRAKRRCTAKASAAHLLNQDGRNIVQNVNVGLDEVLCPPVCPLHQTLDLHTSHIHFHEVSMPNRCWCQCPRYTFEPLCSNKDALRTAHPAHPTHSTQWQASPAFTTTQLHGKHQEK